MTKARQCNKGDIKGAVRNKGGVPTRSSDHEHHLAGALLTPLSSSSSRKVAVCGTSPSPCSAANATSNGRTCQSTERTLMILLVESSSTARVVVRCSTLSLAMLSLSL